MTEMKQQGLRYLGFLLLLGIVGIGLFALLNQKSSGVACSICGKSFSQEEIGFHEIECKKQHAR